MTAGGWSLGPYNGWSGEQRRAGTPIQQQAVREGTIARPITCTICTAVSSPDNPVWFHDEDYARPLSAYHVCRRCHLALHRRFDYLEAWLDLVARHYREGAWFTLLTLDPESLVRPFRETYSNGLPPEDTGREGDPNLIEPA